MAKQINVALIGNPNTGKTSVFNQAPIVSTHHQWMKVLL